MDTDPNIGANMRSVEEIIFDLTNPNEHDANNIKAIFSSN